MNDHRIFNANCLDVLAIQKPHTIHCLFADPPDNLGLKYNTYYDRIPDNQYYDLLGRWIKSFIKYSAITWLSFNPKHTLEVAGNVNHLKGFLDWKPCVQVFTFGQHNQYDLGPCHRSLWRWRWRDAPLYPDQIRVQSWRQKNGDKRADPRGRVPGDVFNFPRVTGNSKQRRKWCPTQLHEGLVERCILLSTKKGDLVFDPFAGTGTVLRVCKRIGRRCVSCEIDASYCAEIAKEHDLEVEKV